MIRESIKRINEQEVFQTDFNEVLLGMAILEQMDPNEPLNEGVNNILGKFGLELEKKSPGVIEYMYKFSKGIGKMIWFAIKKDTKGIEKLSKEFNKEMFLDFLYKLDLVTMHFITGPLHFIDGITGWGLEVKIKELATDADKLVSKMKNALEVVKKEVASYFAPTLQPLVLSKVQDIEKML